MRRVSASIRLASAVAAAREGKTGQSGYWAPPHYLRELPGPLAAVAKLGNVRFVRVGRGSLPLCVGLLAAHPRIHRLFVKPE
jgi:hypothetical protein